MLLHTYKVTTKLILGYLGLCSAAIFGGPMDAPRGTRGIKIESARCSAIVYPKDSIYNALDQGVRWLNSPAHDDEFQHLDIYKRKHGEQLPYDGPYYKYHIESPLNGINQDALIIFNKEGYLVNVIYYATSGWATQFSSQRRITKYCRLEFLESN